MGVGSEETFCMAHLPDGALTFRAAAVTALARRRGRVGSAVRLRMRKCLGKIKERAPHCQAAAFCLSVGAIARGTRRLTAQMRHEKYLGASSAIKAF